MLEGFAPCEICGGARWQIHYRGAVRDGRFGQQLHGVEVGRCEDCGVDRLEEDSCQKEDFYEGTDYRKNLGEAQDAAGFFAAHDATQLTNLAALWDEPTPLRGKVIADVGCAAGSFLDHVSGLASRIVAIEPCEAYHDSLRDRGYTVHPFSHDAAAAEPGVADLATSFAVIEHVPNPRAVLADMATLLAPGGRVVISTPNRDDVLMDLLAEEFPAFFYRTQHRWYFDADSLARCAELAGLEVVEVRSVHRYGLANTLRWLRDKRPGGTTPIDGVSSAGLDAAWGRHLEALGKADYLYGVFKLPDPPL